MIRNFYLNFKGNVYFRITCHALYDIYLFTPFWFIRTFPTITFFIILLGILSLIYDLWKPFYIIFTILQHIFTFVSIAGDIALRQRYEKPLPWEVDYQHPDQSESESESSSEPELPPYEPAELGPNDIDMDGVD